MLLILDINKSSTKKKFKNKNKIKKLSSKSNKKELSCLNMDKELTDMHQRVKKNSNQKIFRTMKYNLNLWIFQAFKLY